MFSFGCVGTCWGSYMVLRESAYDFMKAGVSMHPSHTPIAGLLGEDVGSLEMLGMNTKSRR